MFNHFGSNQMRKAPNNTEIVYTSIIYLKKKNKEITIKEIQNVAGIRDSELESALADLEGTGAIITKEEGGVILYEPADENKKISRETFADWNAKHPEKAYSLNDLR